MARIQRFADLTTLPFVLNEAHKSRTSRLEQVVSFGQKNIGQNVLYSKTTRGEGGEKRRRERVLGLVNANPCATAGTYIVGCS